MGIFGTTGIQHWQITPIGVQRLRSGNLKGVGPAEGQVLQGIVELGGIAETDELTVGSQISPGVIMTSLKRLVDLGLVSPVAPESMRGQPATAPQAPGTTTLPSFGRGR